MFTTYNVKKIINKSGGTTNPIINKLFSETGCQCGIIPVIIFTIYCYNNKEIIKNQVAKLMPNSTDGYILLPETGNRTFLSALCRHRNK